MSIFLKKIQRVNPQVAQGREEIQGPHGAGPLVGREPGDARQPERGATPLL